MRVISGRKGVKGEGHRSMLSARKQLLVRFLLGWWGIQWSPLLGPSAQWVLKSCSTPCPSPSHKPLPAEGLPPPDRMSHDCLSWAPFPVRVRVPQAEVTSFRKATPEGGVSCWALGLA